MTTHSVKYLRSVAQVAFFSALFFACYEAVIPPHKTIPLFPWDKAEHFAAFYVLTWLAAAAFPRSRLMVIGIGLSGFGALLELVQAIPALGRDCDYKDWIADTAGILATWAPMLLIWWRKLFVHLPRPKTGL